MTRLLRPLLVMGTRPEAIKMAPIVTKCLARPDEVSPIVCFTGQHQEMLRGVTDYFGIEPDAELNVMAAGQSLAELMSRCLAGIDRVIADFTPDCVVAQGDTASVVAGSMAAFFRGVPFVHVEAGLRTGDLLAPFPEEYHRRITAISASLHCAPTNGSAENLLQEGVDVADIRVTGNTVFDALLATRDREQARTAYWEGMFPFLAGRDMVLITAHRRENHGDPLAAVLSAIATLAKQFPEMAFVFPVHRNPHVVAAADRWLNGINNVYLLEPQPYPAFVWLMNRAQLIVSDSGGVQEEAPSLGKPVLVTREVTERPEAWEAGALLLVGTDSERIEHEARRLLTDADAYRAMQIPSNPYGDGCSANRIVDEMVSRYCVETSLARKVATPTIVSALRP